jgi:hypothetical protein
VQPWIATVTKANFVCVWDWMAQQVGAALHRVPRGLTGAPGFLGRAAQLPCRSQWGGAWDLCMHINTGPLLADCNPPFSCMIHAYHDPGGRAWQGACTLASMPKCSFPSLAHTGHAACVHACMQVVAEFQLGGSEDELLQDADIAASAKDPGFQQNPSLAEQISREPAPGPQSLLGLSSRSSTGAVRDIKFLDMEASALPTTGGCGHCPFRLLSLLS